MLDLLVQATRKLNLVLVACRISAGGNLLSGFLGVITATHNYKCAVIRATRRLPPAPDGAKDYFYISDVDDRDYLTALIKATIPALPKPKAKKNPFK